MDDISAFMGLLLSFRPPQGSEARETPSLAALVLDAEDVFTIVESLVAVVEQDGEAADAAAGVLDKLATVLPPEVLTPGGGYEDEDDETLDAIAAGIAEGCKLRLTYCDATATVTERIVRPVLVLDTRRGGVLHAWCELRDDFRVFLVDRILEIAVLEDTWPGGHARLLAAWKTANETDGGL